MPEGVSDSGSFRSRSRPPRRPRRRAGSSLAIASLSASISDARARMLASGQASGLRASARSSSRPRSSGVRARRPIRCRRSRYFWRRRAASAAPSTSASGERSAGSAGAGGRSVAGRLPPPRRRGGRCARPAAGSGRVTIASRVRAFQSKFKSGCVCSSASRTSLSRAVRPTRRFAGDRNRYSTRGAPCPWRCWCSTSVCSNPRLSRDCRMNGTIAFLAPISSERISRRASSLVWPASRRVWL